jgi:hypothetical protein
MDRAGQDPYEYGPYDDDPSDDERTDRQYGGRRRPQVPVIVLHTSCTCGTKEPVTVEEAASALAQVIQTDAGRRRFQQASALVQMEALVKVGLAVLAGDEDAEQSPKKAAGRGTVQGGEGDDKKATPTDLAKLLTLAGTKTDISATLASILGDVCEYSTKDSRELQKAWRLFHAASYDAWSVQSAAGAPVKGADGAPVARDACAATLLRILDVERAPPAAPACKDAVQAARRTLAESKTKDAEKTDLALARDKWLAASQRAEAELQACNTDRASLAQACKDAREKAAEASAADLKRAAEASAADLKRAAAASAVTLARAREENDAALERLRQENAAALDRMRKENGEALDRAGSERTALSRANEAALAKAAEDCTRARETAVQNARAECETNLTAAQGNSAREAAHRDAALRAAVQKEREAAQTAAQSAARAVAEANERASQCATQQQEQLRASDSMVAKLTAERDAATRQAEQATATVQRLEKQVEEAHVRTRELEAQRAANGQQAEAAATDENMRLRLELQKAQEAAAQVRVRAEQVEERCRQAEESKSTTDQALVAKDAALKSAQDDVRELREQVAACTAENEKLAAEAQRAALQQAEAQRTALQQAKDRDAALQQANEANVVQVRAARDQAKREYEGELAKAHTQYAGAMEQQRASAVQQVAEALADQAKAREVEQKQAEIRAAQQCDAHVAQQIAQVREELEAAAKAAEAERGECAKGLRAQLDLQKEKNLCNIMRAAAERLYECRTALRSVSDERASEEEQLRAERTRLQEDAARMNKMTEQLRECDTRRAEMLRLDIQHNGQLLKLNAEHAEEVKRLRDANDALTRQMATAEDKARKEIASLQKQVTDAKGETARVEQAARDRQSVHSQKYADALAGWNACIEHRRVVDEACRARGGVNGDDGMCDILALLRTTTEAERTADAQALYAKLCEGVALDARPQYVMTHLGALATPGGKIMTLAQLGERVREAAKYEAKLRKLLSEYSYYPGYTATPADTIVEQLTEIIKKDRASAIASRQEAYEARQGARTAHDDNAKRGEELRKCELKSKPLCRQLGCLNAQDEVDEAKLKQVQQALTRVELSGFMHKKHLYERLRGLVELEEQMLFEVHNMLDRYGEKRPENLEESELVNVFKTFATQQREDSDMAHRWMAYMVIDALNRREDLMQKIKGRPPVRVAVDSRGNYVVMSGATKLCEMSEKYFEEAVFNHAACARILTSVAVALKTLSNAKFKNVEFTSVTGDILTFKTKKRSDVKVDVIDMAKRAARGAYGFQVFAHRMAAAVNIKWPRDAVFAEYVEKVPGDEYGRKMKLFFPKGTTTIDLLAIAKEVERRVNTNRSAAQNTLTAATDAGDGQSAQTETTVREQASDAGTGAGTGAGASP